MNSSQLTPYLTPCKYGREVLGPSGISEQYDDQGVDCPFVFRHNNRYYMMHVGFDGVGYQTALAVSDDLLHWQREALIFPRGEQHGWDQGGVAGMWILRENDLFDEATLKKVNGKYWMIYHSYPRAGYEAGPAQIGLAWTEDESLHHWNRLEQPILSWKDGDNWERGGLYKGCLVENEGRYYLFYNAKDQQEWPWHEQIGIAVSEDLLHWSRLPGNPVIANTPDAWDERFCADPCVMRHGDEWVMYYYGYNGQSAQEGIAFSKDLLHWHKHPAPILTPGQPDDIDANYAHKPGVIARDGMLYHFYCAVRKNPQLGAERREYRCITVAASHTKAFAKTPLDYAIAACETMMRRYAAADLPPKRHFHYHQGVFLSGMHETWKLCGDDRYFQYIKDWVDSVFDAQGHILEYTHGDLDDIQPGILLFPLLNRTQDPYYEKCLAAVVQEVRDIPRNPEGGWWHKVNMKDQMWLDGLYMSGPFCAEYAKHSGCRALADEVVRQALMMEEKTFDPATGLLYHAWDGAKEEEWADPVTGRASEFWGRAMGWVPVALLNDLDFLPEDLENRDEVIRMATQLLTNLCRYQSEEGRWYQVVNKGDQPGNWLENSCSCLYVAGLCKAIRRGYLDKQYWENARRGYEGVIASLEWLGDDIQIGHVCIGTGVGDYEHYCKRPVSTNDLHGVGAFLIMCTEVQKLMNSGLVS